MAHVIMNDISAGLGRFMRWWGRELAGLVPVARPARSMSPRLVLDLEDERARLLREANGEVTVVGDGEPVVIEALPLPLGQARALRLPIGIRVPIAECLVREMPLPADARARFADILQLDLERATPFRQGDVWSAVTFPDRAPPGGMVPVRQLVLRRAKLEPWLAVLSEQGLPATFLDAWEADGTAIPVDFLAAAEAPRGSAATGRRLMLLALCTALGAAALWIWSSRQGEAVASLRAETAVARDKAQRAQRMLDNATGLLGDFNALRQRSTGHVSLTEVLDGLTRLIPDQAFVQDLKIDGRSIELTGLAQNAAALLPLLERSPLFTEARFISPVLLDPTAGRERFAIALRLRPLAGDPPPGRDIEPQPHGGPTPPAQPQQQVQPPLPQPLPQPQSGGRR